MSIGPLEQQDGAPLEIFADRSYRAPGDDLTDIEVAPYGYRWIRLKRTIGGRAGSARFG